MSIKKNLANSKNNIIYCCIESYNVFSYNADQDEITLGQIIDVVSLQEINANLDSVLYRTNQSKTRVYIHGNDTKEI